MEQLPVEIAASVLKYFDTNELIRLTEKSIPENFRQAIKEKHIWKRKTLIINSKKECERYIDRLSKISSCENVVFRDESIPRVTIMNLLMNMRSLQSLVLENMIHVDDHVLSMSIIASGKSLRHLSLKGCTSITNNAIFAISRQCPNLESLNLSGCPISYSGLEMLTENDNIVASLKHLSISRCFLLDNSAVIALFKFKNLQTLDIRRTFWLNSSNLSCIIQDMPMIRKIDIRDCEDFTKQSVEQVRSSIDHMVEIIENTKLNDESPDSIRGYLMAMINAQIL